MFGKAEKVEKDEKDNTHSDRVVASLQEATRLLHRLVGARDPGHSEAASSISSGLSIVGKIIGRGALTIFGHVEQQPS